MSFTLRPYQSNALEATFDYFREGKGTAPIVELPTGSGKSLIAAKFCETTLRQAPHARIAVVANVKELVSQNAEELLALWPEAPAGIYSAGYNRRDKDASIIFCSIQTIHNKIKDMQWLDALLIDECDTVPHKGEGMYRSFIDQMRKINPRMIVVGMSATPYRLNGGYLHKGEGAIFDGISYKVDILDLVKDGYLAPLVARDVRTHLDASGVRKSGGEFVQSALQSAVDKESVNKTIASEIVEFGADRKCWIVFGAGVEHCNHLRDEIRALGVDAECVFGDTPKSERDNIIRRHKSLELRCLVTRFVATRGFNNKAIDLIADAAPTESQALHVQKMGRGTRLFPGKRDCLVLGFAQNTERHGPIDKVRPKEPSRRMSQEEKALLKTSKTCPDCEASLHISIRECPNCSWQFGDGGGPRLNETASTMAPMSNGQPTWIPIDRVTYAAHEARSGKGTTLKVQYWTGLKSYPSWVCLEHQGRARRNAENWWIKHAGTTPPSNVQEALNRKEEIRTPEAISIIRSGKHWDVIDAR